jgi:hypothetical protein
VLKEKFVIWSFKYISLRVFVVNYNHSLTTEVYRSFGKGDQVEELSRGSEKTTAVAGKWVTCLVQECFECFNCKGLVSINIL